jgi:tRNA modification GTPase
MRRTERLLEQSDLILLLIDGSEALQDEFRHAGVEKYQNDPRCIVVWNKSDLSVGKAPSGSFPLSAKKGKGYAELEAEILRRLRRGGEKPDNDQVVIESARQRDALVRSAQALEAAIRLAKAEVPLDIVAIELNEAMDALGSLTGEVASTDILEHIFSGFCVGK